MKAKSTYQRDVKSQLGDNLMNMHFPLQSVSLSTMISETAYRVVVGVERLARFTRGVFRSDK